MIETIQV